MTIKWGLMGGTFDPIHIGHLRCAQEVLEMFSLDQIIFVPSAVPPLKARHGLTDFKHRKAMVMLAIDGNQHFSCSDIEEKREGKSYTIDTIRYFQETHGTELLLHFILGQDAFLEIQKWKDWKKLLTLCHFVIMTEPETEPEDLMGVALPAVFAAQFRFNRAVDGFIGPSGYTLFFRKVTLLDIHSTDIRRQIRGGMSIRYLVPDPVRKYIGDHVLYAAS
jgi:nicotinate-nucleotide adenylyltransferase